MVKRVSLRPVSSYSMRFLKAGFERISLLDKCVDYRALIAVKGERSLYEKLIDASFWEASTHSAKLCVVKRETTAAITMDINRAGPLILATVPVTTNIPAPMMAPTLMAVASSKPSVGFSLSRLSSMLLSAC